MEKWKKFKKVCDRVFVCFSIVSLTFSVIGLLCSWLTGRMTQQTQTGLECILIMSVYMLFVSWCFKRYEKRIREYEEMMQLYKEIFERTEEIQKLQDEIIQKQRESFVRADMIIEQKQGMIEELKKKQNENDRLHGRKRNGRKARSYWESFSASRGKSSSRT